MFIGVDRNFDLFDDVACIHADIHLHECDTCYLVAFQYSALYGSRTSSCRKKASVAVDAAVFGKIQNSLRKDLSVSCSNDKICVVRRKLFERLLSL